MQCCAPLFIKDMKPEGLNAFRAGQQSWEKDLKLCPLRSSHSSKRRRLRPYCSLQFCKVRKQEGDAGASLVSSDKMNGNVSKCGIKGDAG